MFDQLLACGYNTEKIGQKLGLSRRTISDWKRGKYNIEQVSFLKLVDLTDIAIQDLHYEIIDPDKQRLFASSLGGKAKWKKYRSIGTIEDRRKGGHTSYRNRYKDQDDIFARTKIKKHQKSVTLAEFIGICMGDGSITNYQVTISLNSEDDKEYISYVSECVKELFGLKVKLQKRTKKKCMNVVISSVELVELLMGYGLPKGDKIRANLDIPDWILRNRDYTIACLRGLFDTDGCIYLETHKRKSGAYSYPRLSFVSASEPLRQSVCDAYNDLEITGKIRMNRSVNIERFTDVEKYFKIVGSSNDKHLRRFAQFGRVG
jgi:transcriptional regulator with XRE-family HTH domain